jgi:large subunit ribosomal protein L10
MNRSGKEAIVASLKSDFSHSEAAFLVGVKGLTVEQFSQLRAKLREQDARLQVAKVRLMKLALQDFSQAADLKPYLCEQIGLVFAKKEMTVVAKILCDYSNEVEKLRIVAGSMSSNVLSEHAVRTIASLPSREVLLSQVARGLQAPTANFVGILHQLIARLVYVLKQIEQKKQNV